MNRQDEKEGEIIKSAPSSKVQTRTAHVTAESFAGPIPRPAILQGYEQIVPGSAERIIKMAEAQAAHRQSLEARVVRSDTRKSVLGIWFAFFIALFTVSAGVFTTIQGYPLPGTIFGVSGLSGIIGAFIYQRQEEKNK